MYHLPLWTLFSMLFLGWNFSICGFLGVCVCVWFDPEYQHLETEEVVGLPINVSRKKQVIFLSLTDCICTYWSPKENIIAQRKNKRWPVHSSLGSPFFLYNPEKLKNSPFNIYKETNETKLVYQKNKSWVA